MYETAKPPSCVRQHAPNLQKSVRYRKVFLAKRRNNLRFPFWQSFVSLVIAAQCSVSSPPKAVARASPSVAPPSLQTSKLPSFSGRPSCPSCSPQNIPHPPSAPPVAPQGRSLFSVLCGRGRFALRAARSVLRGGISRPSPFQSAGRQKTLAPGRDMLLFYCHALGEPMQRFVQTHKGHRTKRRNFRSIVRMRARVIACPCRCHWAGILRPRTRHRRRARLFAPCPPPQPPGDR